MYKIAKLTFFAITETRLTQNDAVVCTEITPAGYRFLQRPRADRVGGDTALLYKESFNIRQFAAGEKSSFEFSEYLIDASSHLFCGSPYHFKYLLSGIQRLPRFVIAIQSSTLYIWRF